MIYLDNAATTWPKPVGVYEAVSDALMNKGGNPGRSAHKTSVAAGKVLDSVRFSLARLLGVRDPNRIVFALNATDALNLAIGGVLSPGDHAVTSSMEHNSVTRPLEHMAKGGLEYTRIRMDPVAGVDPRDVEKALRPNTKLVVLTHASNIAGTVNPVADIGALCRERGVFFLVDAAQSAGSLPIDVEAMNIDLLAFPGHKGLFGPTGTGGLYIAEGVDVNPARYGGTGVFSEFPLQPDELPFRYESGTQNFHGLAGLDAGVRFIADKGTDAIHSHELRLVNLLTDGLHDIPEVTVYGPPPGAERAAVVSLNIKGMNCAEAALILDASFDIAIRSGLHCAPDAHRTLGTFELGGTLRVSPGFFNTDEDIARCVEGIAEIAREA
ncbi:MAG: aminotransferase class V-fold PLP-dependent enzyme [Clostridiales Family XIII bacterium]|jgi:cysteine desulfurase family protein|nr:aminotransferase class V-fold PLP-dependent enzyme [Clostridiales Family XIII bacterium]